MKKVGILTMNGNHNYGNRLQNYALQDILKKRGYQAETIVIPRLKHVNERKLYKRIFRIAKNPISYIKRNAVSTQSVKSLKEEKIRPFTDRYLNTRAIKISQKKQLNSEFDFFVVGSDQVWNPNFFGKDSTNFLDFAEKGKRISYAASFGVSLINDEFKDFYRSNLLKMDNISVRETSGKKIVEELLGESVPVVLDPTMLLSKEEWLNLAHNEVKQIKIEEAYILIYTLRGVSEEVSEKIKKYAQIKNLKVVFIMGDLYQENALVPTVTEFIELINKAHIFFTDSFHGTVFSILLETAFVTLERDGGNMESRLLTLLNKFEFTSNYFYSEMDIENVCSQMSFEHVPPILHQEKELAFQFLDDSLS
ncbi:polysaccharide pyruvyl transferase family protein [Enterococcus sp. AZ192]|uniref:polysaccharide pyruvyl transferase family protein n=1 Tax=unclassified Enterococcus TaxID=2608891 RepID=UPI003D2709CD